MANYVFNSGKGRVAELANTSPTALNLLVLKSAAVQGTNEDYDTLAALLGDAGNTEADFTNYARVDLQNVTYILDDTGNKSRVDADDVLFASAGGATNNTCVSVVIFEDNASDALSIPLVHLDASFTTDGNDVTLQFDASGFYEAV